MDLTQLGAWRTLLQPELEKPYFSQLVRRVDAAYAGGTVYPPQQELFSAFSLTPPEQVRVVILGQDPYHEPGQANGLAFSVREGVKLPPSLRNIFKELEDDCGLTLSGSGDLTPWAKQGVFLLNSTLSVAAGQAASHQSFGWQTFTDAVVQAIAALPQPVACILWGSHAQKKAPIIRQCRYPRLIVSSPHPSPLSAYRGFFGSRPFSAVNTFLLHNNQKCVDWQL